jgi:hypothetical protein
MKKYLIIFAILASCQSGNPEKEALKTVTDFLSWYETNYQQANSFGLVNQGDSTVFYSVNFEETEKFLAYLKSSGFVSETYLNNFREYFNKAEQTFKAGPVNEGPPENFDYDIVVLTQEPELVFEKKNSPVVLSSDVKKNTAVLNLSIGMQLQFKLSKENSKWLIDQISYFGE